MISEQDLDFFKSLPITKQTVDQRIDECFVDFSLCLPIYDEDTRRNIRMVMELDTADLIPEWFHDLGVACKLYTRQFFPYLDYIAEAIPYIQGKSDTRPKIDIEEEARDDVLKMIRQKQLLEQIKQNKKNRKQRRADWKKIGN